VYKTLEMYTLYIIVPAMIVNATDARNRFLDLLNRAGYGKERIQIERHGKPVAALISCEDLARLEALEDAHDSALLRQAMQASQGLVGVDALLAARPIADQVEGE
jgi:prevent-host-death family protein